MAGSWSEVRASYIRERPTYRALAERAVALLEPRLSAAGVVAKLGFRVKEVDSFVKKVLRTPGYVTGEKEIFDRAGVRVLLPHLDDEPRVQSVIESCCDVHERDVKVEKLGADRLGYLGIHYVVSLQHEVLGDEDRTLFEGLKAEIQVQSIAQNAWAEVSHELIYKAPVDPPDAHKRMLNRLIALVELFDTEVERCRAAIQELPGYEQNKIVDPLDRELLKFTGRQPDRALSQEVTPSLVGLYDKPVDRVLSEDVGPWIESNRAKLADIFDRHAGKADANPLLTQPEAFLIFERAENDPDGLVRALPDSLPRELFVSLTELWGHPIE